MSKKHYIFFEKMLQKYLTFSNRLKTGKKILTNHWELNRLRYVYRKEPLGLCPRLFAEMGISCSGDGKKNKTNNKEIAGGNDENI